MLTFYPEFESTSDTEGQTTGADFEVTFILDLSNSMTGATLVDAKKVILLALRRLPPTCLFNIIVFGSRNYLPFVFRIRRKKIWWDCVKNVMENLGLSHKDAPFKNKL